MAQKGPKLKTYLKLSPALGDGQHFAIVETPQQVLELLEEWFAENREYPQHSDVVEISLCRMDETEVEGMRSL